MAYKLLLTDAYSPLGSALSHVLEQETFTLLRPHPEELAWGDRRAVDRYLREQQPNILINTLAWCELAEKQHRVLLVNAAKALVRPCTELNICVVHLSSHRVFGGENKTAYDESDQPSPVDAMGRALREAERIFADKLVHHITLRLSWLIGIQGDNLLPRLVRRLSSGQEVVVDPAVRGTPTFMADVGRVLVAMVKQMLCGADNWGVMHYSSGDPCSEAEFAQQLARLLQRCGEFKGVVKEVDNEQAQPVPSAVLSGRRCRDNFGIQARTWRRDLPRAVALCLGVDEAVSGDQAGR